MSFTLLLTHQISFVPKQENKLGLCGEKILFVSNMSHFSFLKEKVLLSVGMSSVSDPGPAGQDSGQSTYWSLCCRPNLQSSNSNSYSCVQLTVNSQSIQSGDQGHETKERCDEINCLSDV